jgi:DNA-binding transcriptional LysR family regulator
MLSGAAALLSFAMELKQIRQVVAVCNTGSFSGAAKALRISQPTLSKSIARLERTLKIRLFDRSGGSAKPTDYGQLVAEHGERLLSGVADLSRQIEQLGKGQTGRLRIGVGPATRYKLLPEVIRQISLSFPGLQLQARHDDIPALVRALRVGRLDLVFCSFEGANEWDDLIRTKVCEDRRIAVVRPGHPALRKKSPVSPEQLARYPIASVGAVPGLQSWLSVAAEGKAKNVLAFVSDDYDLVKRRPVGTDFVACGPSFVFERELGDGSLVELPLDASFRYECWMLTTETKWRSPITRKIAGFARSAMRRKSGG